MHEVDEGSHTMFVTTENRVANTGQPTSTAQNRNSPMGRFQIKVLTTLPVLFPLFCSFRGQNVKICSCHFEF